jgi:hypothetical protein
MKAFAVFVNGQQVCTAGIGPDGVLTAILDWVGGGPRQTPEGLFGLHVGGLDSQTDEHVDWSVPEVGVGDEVTIRIVETEDIDPEARRRKADRQQGEG